VAAEDLSPASCGESPGCSTGIVTAHDRPIKLRASASPKAAEHDANACGVGKTTTVRILGTLISATAGSAAVAGIPVGLASAGEIRQRISIMPESPGAVPGLRDRGVTVFLTTHRLDEAERLCDRLFDRERLVTGRQH